MNVVSVIQSWYLCVSKHFPKNATFSDYLITLLFFVVVGGQSSSQQITQFLFFPNSRDKQFSCSACSFNIFLIPSFDWCDFFQFSFDFVRSLDWILILSMMNTRAAEVCCDDNYNKRNGLKVFHVEYPVDRRKTCCDVTIFLETKTSRVSSHLATHDELALTFTQMLPVLRYSGFFGSPDRRRFASTAETWPKYADVDRLGLAAKIMPTKRWPWHGLVCRRFVPSARSDRDGTFFCSDVPVREVVCSVEELLKFARSFPISCIVPVREVHFIHSFSCFT